MTQQTPPAIVLQQFGQWLQQWADFTVAQAALADSSAPGEARPGERSMPLPDADSDDPPAHWLADTGQVDGPPEHWLALLREHKAEWLVDVAGEGRIGNPEGRIGNPDTEPDPYQLTGTGANTLAPPDAWLPDLRQGFLFFLEAFGFSPPEDPGDAGQIVAENEHGETAEPPHSSQSTNAPERPSGLKGEQPASKQPFLEAPTSQPAPGEDAEPEQAANIGDKSSQKPAWTPPTLSAAPTQVIQRWRLPEQEAAPGEGWTGVGGHTPLASIPAELPPEPSARMTGPIEPPSPRYPIQRAESSAPASSEIVESMEAERPPMFPAHPAGPETAVSNQAHKPSERTPTAVDSPQPAGQSLAAPRKTKKRPAAPDRGVPPPILSLPAQETSDQSSTRPNEAEQIAPAPFAPVEERAMILTPEPIVQRPPAAAGTHVPHPGRVTRLQLHYSPPKPPQRPMTAEAIAWPAPQSGQQSQEGHISGGEPDPVERPVNTVPPQNEYQVPVPRPPERRERPERVMPLKPPETAERRQPNLVPPPAEPPQSSKQEPWPELPKRPRLANLGQSRRRDSSRRRRLDSEQRGRRWNG